MKAKLFLSFLLFGIFFMMGQQAMAQVDDSLPPWFKAPERLLTQDDILNKAYAFTIPQTVMKSARPISANMSKSMKLPRRVRRLPSPITVKRDGKCYRIGCAKGDKCDKCNLLWLDKNRDGKVQPRAELRCRCTDGSRCRIRGKRVDCK